MSDLTIISLTTTEILISHYVLLRSLPSYPFSPNSLIFLTTWFKYFIILLSICVHNPLKLKLTSSTGESESKISSKSDKDGWSPSIVYKLPVVFFGCEGE